MNKRISIHLFFAILFIVIIHSKSFSQFAVISTSPTNGAANINPSSTLSITFSAAIDTNARFIFPGDIFLELIFNPDSLLGEPDSITFSADMQTVYFHNLHLSQFTDYRFCILNAVSTLGDSLDSPYSFSFTTNPAMSFNATVSGMVGPNPFGAMVFLFDSNPFESEESFWGTWAVATPATGSYTVDFVAPGFYWPVVIRNFYLDDEGDIDIQDGSELGYFDSNGDHRPDSIFVSSGSNITGVDMLMKDIFLQTARGPVAALDLIAQSWQSDAQLVEFGGDDLLPDGNSMFWQFTYYSPSVLNSKQWLSSGDLIISIKDDSINTDTTALPLNWVDSDSVMAVAENNGGSQFRQNYLDAQVSGGCGFFSPQFKKQKYIPGNTKSSIKKAVWSIEYYSESNWQYMNILIDALTGQILNSPVTAAETEQAAMLDAQDWAQDAKLWRIENQGSSVNALGKTDYWRCIYYSFQKDSLHEINLWGLLPYWAGTPVGLSPDSTTIMQGWINSDTALDSAEILGGSDYRQNNQNVIVNAALGQWYNGIVPDSIVWHITYYSSTSNPLEIVLDPYSLNSMDEHNEYFIPSKFVLKQNFPNPFNPITTIEFNLPKSSEVNLIIYNIVGQEIEKVEMKELTAGDHKIQWNASHLPSGIYFYKITAGEYSSIKKCVLIK